MTSLLHLLLGLSVAKILATSFDVFSDDDFEIKSNAFNYCAGNACYTQQDCCSHTACVKRPGEHMGKCHRLVGQSEGALCLVAQSPPSCRRSLHCYTLDERDRLGVCRNPGLKYKQRAAGEKCATTNDCDLTDGLCCRTLMHGRAVEQRICDFYEDVVNDCLFI